MAMLAMSTIVAAAKRRSSQLVCKYPRFFGLRPDHEVVVLEDGSELGFMVIGDGPIKVVYVHGIIGTPYVMRVLLILARALGLTIYAFFIPCHGPSAKTSSFFQAVEWLAEAAHKLGLIGAPWIGHSLGGLLASHVADRYPGLVSRLVTMGMPTSHPNRPIGYKIKGGLVVADVIITSMVAVLTAPSRQEARELVGVMAHTLAEPVEFEEAVALLLDAPRDLRATLERIEDRGVPQMHIQGVLDFPVGVSRGHRRLPGQRVLLWPHNGPLLPGAAHAIVALVATFLDLPIPTTRPVTAQ